MLTVPEIRATFREYAPAQASIAVIREEIANLERIKADLENEEYDGVLSRGGDGGGTKDFGVADPTPAQAQRFEGGADRNAVSEIIDEIIVLRKRLAEHLRLIRTCDEWLSRFPQETACLLRARYIEKKTLMMSITATFAQTNFDFSDDTAKKTLDRALAEISRRWS